MASGAAGIVSAGAAGKTASSATVADAVRPFAQQLHGGDRDFDSLIKAIGDAKYVLIGEASHGTHDFYRERAEITKRLIVEQGFAAVALEADFPDTATINAFVKGGLSRGAESIQALADFQRFPAWMWRNTVMLDFLGWLRDLNDGRPPEAKVGVYGLDLYSLVRAIVGPCHWPRPTHLTRAQYACAARPRSQHAAPPTPPLATRAMQYRSISEVLTYLRKVDPAAAERAAHFYACFRGYRRVVGY